MEAVTTRKKFRNRRDWYKRYCDEPGSVHGCDNIKVDECENRYTPYDPRWYFPDGETPKKTSQVGFETGRPSKPKLYEDYDCGVDEEECLREDYSFDAIHYLFPCRETDYLIRRNKECDNEEKVYADDLQGIRYLVIISFYIPVLKHDEVALLCCNLLGIFNELASEGRLADYEFVLVPRMRSDFPSFDNKQVAEDAFTHFFSAFSPGFLAVPIFDSPRTLNLIRVMGSACYDMPGCSVADLEKGQISHLGIHDLCSLGPDLYPFTPSSERLLEVRKQADTIRAGRMPLATLLDRQSSDVLECVCHSEPSCGKQESLSSLSNKVVWLYYFNKGEFLDKLCHLYKLCKAKGFEFELVVVRADRGQGDKPTLSSSWEDHVQSLLQNRDSCGWLHLPFTHRVNCRLAPLCRFSLYDKLVIVGPNNDYFDIDGKEVYLDYGIGAYPFTKQTVWDNEVARLRGLSLQDWLRRGGIQRLKRGSENLPVSYLEDKDVLVYFGAISSSGKLSSDYDGHLFKWISEMKSASEVGVEVIFVCKNDLNVSPTIDNYLSEIGWFIPFPYDKECNAALIESLFGKPGVWNGTLVAFGSNGRLLRVGVERSLGNSEPAIFPHSNHSLHTDVRFMLTSQLGNHVWFYAFRDQLYSNI